MDLPEGLFELARPGKNELSDARAHLAALDLDMNIARVLNELRYFRLYIVHIAIQKILDGRPEVKQVRMDYAEHVHRSDGEKPLFLHRLRGYEAVVKTRRPGGIFEQFSIHCVDRIEPSLVAFSRRVVEDLAKKTEALIGFFDQRIARGLDKK